MIIKCKIILIFLISISIFSGAFKEVKEIHIYVSPSGNDLANGDKLSPFKTIIRSQAYIRSLKLENYTRVVVNLRKGLYVIDKPIVFAAKDGGTKDCVIEYKAFQNEEVIISGGLKLASNWRRVKSGSNIWKLKIQDSLPSINQLFANGIRLKRSTSPVRYTDGALKQYRKMLDSFGRYNFIAIEQLKRNDLLPFSSFVYKDKDLEGITDLANAELLIYHSWDASWHKIASVNETDKTVFLKSPSVFPVGFFSNRNRYVIENSKLFLKKEGDWCFDSKLNELWYVSLANKSPNKIEFVTPAVDQLLIIKGDPKAHSFVQNIKFSGIKFHYNRAPRGINIEGRLVSATNKLSFLDVKTGFSGYQAAVECGQAIWLQNANNIVFERCTFSKLGTYALRADQYTNRTHIEDCKFYDLGGGGIVLGYNIRNAPTQGVPAVASPTNNVIKDNKIYNGGIIYPSAVGIALMNTTDSYIFNNEVYDFGYSGISLGWTWGFGPSYTYNNRIEKNKIHHVMNLLADGGGIYTLGRQPQTLIVDNIIYNIFKSKDAVGSDNNGIFFDEGSSEMVIGGNLIYNIENQKIRYNQTDSTKIKWRK